MSALKWNCSNAKTNRKCMCTYETLFLSGYCKWAYFALTQSTRTPTTKRNRRKYKTQSCRLNVLVSVTMSLYAVISVSFFTFLFTLLFLSLEWPNFWLIFSLDISLGPKKRWWKYLTLALQYLFETKNAYHHDIWAKKNQSNRISLGWINPQCMYILINHMRYSILTIRISCAQQKCDD